MPPVIPIDEFDREMATTRRVLERVPSEQGRWKPHEKSFALAHLAQLVAWMPGWFPRMLREPNIDLGTGPGYSYETTETLLDEFDRNVADARRALEEVVGPELDEPWSLRMGGNALFTSPRRQVVRENLNHLIHHRGQLTVYLRLLDVPVPMVYGPTADEKWG